MVRFGKCIIKECNGEIHHGSWDHWAQGENKSSDAIGFCIKCYKEYPLIYEGNNTYLTIRRNAHGDTT